MRSERPMRPIPISAAQKIADLYGYDQVVIVARRVGETPEPCGEHVTTFGRNVDHCAVAARIGDRFKHEIMKWPGKLDNAGVLRMAEMISAVLNAGSPGSVLVPGPVDGVVTLSGVVNLLHVTGTLAKRLGVVTLPERKSS